MSAYAVTLLPLALRAAPSVVAVGLLAGLASVVRWDFINALDFGTIWTYRVPLLRGASTTLILTATALALGMVGGAVFTVGARSGLAPVRWITLAAVEFLRDLPLLVMLFWVHFVLPLLTGVSTTPYASGLIALAAQSSAYIADVLQAGIAAIPGGQHEAASALGLPGRVRWSRVILPQAIRIMLPPLTNVATGYIKSSSALAILSVGELMTVSNRIASYTQHPIEVLTASGAAYVAIGLVVGGLGGSLERLLARRGGTQ